MPKEKKEDKKEKSKDKEKDKKDDKKDKSKDKKDDKKEKKDEKPKEEKKSKSKEDSSSSASEQPAASAPNPPAAPPAAPEPPLMVPSGIPGHMVPVQEAYRQKLEMLVNYVHSTLMNTNDALQLAKSAGDSLVQSVESTRAEIARETQYTLQEVIDRLDSEARRRSAVVDSRLHEVRSRQDEIHKFLQRVSTPASTQQQMAQFVNQYDDLKRECDYLARRAIPGFADQLQSANEPDGLLDLPREVREMKARAEGYDKVRKMMAMKDGLIAQLIAENTELRRLNSDLKDELQQWMMQPQPQSQSQSQSVYQNKSASDFKENRSMDAVNLSSGMKLARR